MKVNDKIEWDLAVNGRDFFDTSSVPILIVTRFVYQILQQIGKIGIGS